MIDRHMWKASKILRLLCPLSQETSGGCALFGQEKEDVGFKNQEVQQRREAEGIPPRLLVVRRAPG